MAQGANITSERITGRINDLGRVVRGVFVDAEEWNEFSEMEQIDYSLEWDNDMGAIDLLERSYRAGDFTDEQRRAYVALKDDLRRALPILDKLELSRPPREIITS